MSLPHPPGVASHEFAELMAELPAGVAVVTAASGSQPMGLTVTSLGPFTADPPSVMVCIAHSSRTCEPLLAAEEFGVHLLCGEQEHIARHFVSKAEDKFEGLDWEWDGTIPRLPGALAYLSCRRETSFTYWDHTLIVGVITGAHRQTDRHPLLYLRRGFAWELLQRDLDA
jgi:flavin reductase ActVB